MNDYVDLEQKLQNSASSWPVQRKKIRTGNKIIMYSEMLFRSFTFLDKLIGGFYFLPLKRYLFLPIKKNLKNITKRPKTYKTSQTNSERTHYKDS